MQIYGKVRKPRPMLNRLQDKMDKTQTMGTSMRLMALFHQQINIKRKVVMNSKPTGVKKKKKTKLN